MKMNNIYLRNALIFLVLLFLLAVIVSVRNNFLSGKKQTRFASLPKKEITRIELSENERHLVLTLTADGWKVNGDKEARKNAVLFMIRILSEMSVKSPVSAELFDNVIESKRIEPVVVRVFENRHLLRSFMVFRTNSNRYGNNMKIRGNAKPFIVSLPGYEGDIGSAFTTDELYWKPYTVFNLRPTEISEISLENLSDTTLSFRINKKGEAFNLSDNMKSLTGWDTTRVRRYISYFTWVPFEDWAKDISSEESSRIESRKPLYRMKVVASDGSENSITMWERINDGETDTDRLWAKINGRKEFLLVRYFDIDPLLKRITYFFPQNNNEGE